MLRGLTVAAVVDQHPPVAAAVNGVAVEAIAPVGVAATLAVVAVVTVAAAVVTAVAVGVTGGGNAEESEVRSQYQRRGGACLNDKACATSFLWLLTAGSWPPDF